MLCRRHFLFGLTGALLPLPVRSQMQWGVVHEISGEVTLNDFPVSRSTAVRGGQTFRTGADGRVVFTIGPDAYFLRPNTTLRLETSGIPYQPLVDFLRLVTGAIGATFQRGMRRSLVTANATIGIRGTGVYVETSPDFTYACTCFGATEVAPRNLASMEAVSVAADNHQARIVHASMRVTPAGFERHSNEEMARLEALVGRPNPFRS